MNRKPKTERRKAKALRDPQPEFVSMVPAGANQTPFLVVKSDDGEAPKHQVLGVSFDADKFTDEAAVKAWLDEGGYEEYGDITKADDGAFSVGATEAGDNVALIEMDGVSVYVSKADEAPAAEAEEAGEAVEAEKADAPAEDAEADAADEAVEAAEKAEDGEVAEKSEARQKFDDFFAAWSDEKTVDGVMADGFDGVPPGFHEVAGSSFVAMKNAIIGGDLAGVRKAGADFGDMVATLAAVFPMADMTEAQKTELADALTSEFAAPAVALTPEFAAPAVKADEAPEAPAEAPAADAVEAPAEDTAAKSEDAVQPVASDTEETSAEKAEDAPAVEAADATDAYPKDAETVAEKSDGGSADVTALIKAVADLTTQVGSLHSDLATKADTLASRVDALEGRQTRKSADIEEDVQASPETAQKSEKSREFSQITLRGVLGIARKNV